MSSVDITLAQSPELTWDSVTLSWNDTLCELRSFDGFYLAASYGAAVSESIAFAESASLDVGVTRTEAFSIADSHLKGITHVVEEVLAVADGNVADCSVSLSESIAFAESRLSGIDSAHSEAFSIVDSHLKNITHVVEEVLAVAESTGMNVSYIRSFDEFIGVVDSVSKGFSRTSYESLCVSDVVRRAAEMVISDMVLSSGADMTLDDFEDFLLYGSAPGYQAWRDFIPGDYSYREALVRVVLESSNSDRGLLTGLQMAVDVPDVIDSGTATVAIEDNGIEVEFKREFHIVPEITLSSKGGVGNPTIPEFYGSPSVTGFRVRLRDSITGLYVTGKFTWAAHGY